MLSIPIMFATLLKVEIGILFFISLVPIISLMKKIAELPAGNQFVDMILLAIILGWFFGALKESRKIFTRSPLNWAVLLVMLGSVINLIRGYTFMELPDAELIKLKAWKNYIILPVIYFISINNIGKEKFVKWIIVCVCISMLAMDFNFYTTFRWFKSEHYSHSMRISGPLSFLGPNELGIFYSMYTFLLLGISYFVDNRKLKYLLLFVCACNLYPILYSFSRSGYMCAVAGILFLGVMKDRKFLLLLIVLVIFYRLVLPTSVVERIDMTFLDKEEISAEQEKASAFEVGDSAIEITGRKHLWEKAWNYFKAEPLLGIGFDNFRQKEGWITHSMFFRILAEEGLVGVTIFCLFTFMILQQAFKLFRRSGTRLGKGVGLGFLLCALVHLVGSITGETHLYYNLMAIYWVFLGIVGSFNIEYVGDAGRISKVDTK